MPLKHPLATLLAILPACAFDAQAGASLYVDDAAITPAGHCQAESWARVRAPGQAFTVVPACHWAGTEFGLGISRERNPSQGPQFDLGIKRPLRAVESRRWGVSWSAGAGWDGARHRPAGWNLNLPASFAADREQRTWIHANLGWNQPRDASGALTGGLGIEHAFGERWSVLAEIFGERHGGAGAQLGARRTLGDSASLDLLLGSQEGLREAPWITLGFNVLLPH